MLLLFIALIVLFTLSAGIVLYFRLRRPATPVNDAFLLKYKTFTDLVLKDHPAARLLPGKNSQLFIQLKNNTGLHSLSVTKVQDHVSIVWTWASKGFGQRGKEWSFSLEKDQVQLYEEIKQSRDSYLAELYQKYNLAVPADANL